jgi:hypothetical protein
VEAVKQTLEVSAAKLKEAAPRISEIVLGYAMDPTSPNHEWAARLVAERLWPSRGYAQPLVAAAGGTNGGGSAPSVSITILPATGPFRPDATITVEPTLPALLDEADDVE